MKEYKGYAVEHDETNEDLCFISFAEYEEANDIRFDLSLDGYMIQDLEEIEDEKRYILWFNK